MDSLRAHPDGRMTMHNATETRQANAMASTRSHRRRYYGLGAISLILLLGIVVWCCRHALLVETGRLLVAEDPLESVQVIVASNAITAASALEAGRLLRAGIASQVVLTTWVAQPIREEVRRLGIPYPEPTELARTILERSGVPADAIEVLPQPIDGTASEIALVADFARRRHLEGLMYITTRSHTGRAHWQLRRELPPQTRLIVRSPRTDGFDAESWWHSREHSREVLEQYLHWANVWLLGDVWNRNGPRSSLNAAGTDLPRGRDEGRSLKLEDHAHGAETRLSLASHAVFGAE